MAHLQMEVQIASTLGLKQKGKIQHLGSVEVLAVMGKGIRHLCNKLQQTYSVIGRLQGV